MAEHFIAMWYRFTEKRDSSGLEGLLVEGVVFHSPTVLIQQQMAALLQLKD